MFVKPIKSMELEIGEKMECKALEMIREARYLLDDELKIDSSRELSMTIKKLDKAIMWR